MDVILRCKLATHNKSMTKLSYVNLLQISCRILVELVYSWKSSHRNKKWTFYWDSACMHCMHRRLATRKHARLHVRPSLCLSVCQTSGLWQNRRKFFLDFYTIWKIIYPSFPRRTMVGEGDHFYLKFARSTSAVTPSEQSPININMKSTMRLPMSPKVR